VIAYKVLGRGRVAPFTGFAWPEDEWVEADSVEPCRSGIHACRAADLPYWLGPELWEIELEGGVVVQQRKVIARRGRLSRRIPEWDDGLFETFGRSCLAHTRARYGSIPTLSGYVHDVERLLGQRRHGLVAFVAARAAELDGGPQAYDRERRRQADWLADRLGLGAD
jgi:hypothetical protein